MSSEYPADQPSDALSIAIVGNDALIEALPARPIQFAHACRAAGFDVVLPESWGDELVAEATLRKLESMNVDPAVFCSCPIVRQRLLASGSDLEALLITMVAPPVALARYARVLYGTRVGYLAYIGDCPAARSPEFDVQFRTSDFLEELRRAGIDARDQPLVFDAVLAPDRRRFVSLPGGCPSAEMLWQRCHERALVSLEQDDLAIELAQHLLARQSVLLDVAAALGCHCSGVTATTPGRSARVAVMSLEPPRTSSPVVDSSAVTSLEAPHAPSIGGWDPASRVPRMPGGPVPSSPFPPPAPAPPPSPASPSASASPFAPASQSDRASPSSHSNVGVPAPAMTAGHGPRAPRGPVATTPARVIALVRAAARVARAPEPPDGQAQSAAGSFLDLPSTRQTLPIGLTMVATVESRRERPEPTAPADESVASSQGIQTATRTPASGFPTIRSTGLSSARLPRAYMPRRPLVKRSTVHPGAKESSGLPPSDTAEQEVVSPPAVEVAARPLTPPMLPIAPAALSVLDVRLVPESHLGAHRVAPQEERNLGGSRVLRNVGRGLLALAVLALIAALIRSRLF